LVTTRGRGDNARGVILQCWVIVLRAIYHLRRRERHGKRGGEDNKEVKRGSSGRKTNERDNGRREVSERMNETKRDELNEPAELVASDSKDNRQRRITAALKGGDSVWPREQAGR